MPRVAIILPADSYRARDFVPAAHELGVDLTVISDHPQMLAEEMGAGFLHVDCARPQAAAAAIVQAANETPFDAVFAPDDSGVLIAALAAEELDIPHNPPIAVAATRNKVRLRRSLRGKVRQPRYQISDVTGDVGAVAEHVGFPVVLKPISLSAGRGVIRADDAAAAAVAAERIRLILARAGRSPNEAILVERFVPGPEVAVEGLARNGEVEVLAIFDKPDSMDGPYFEETIYVTPSRLHPEVLDEVREMVGVAVRGVGLVHGPVHAEFRIDGPNVVLIELAARPIGGLCGRALQFGLLGTSLEALILESILGLSRRTPSLAGRSTGVMMLPIRTTGVLRSVGGVDEALEVPGITSIEITAPLGKRIEALPEGDRYLGFMFAGGDSPADTEAALRAGFDRLLIEIDEARGSSPPH